MIINIILAHILVEHLHLHGRVRLRVILGLDFRVAKRSAIDSDTGDNRLIQMYCCRYKLRVILVLVHIVIVMLLIHNRLKCTGLAKD